MDLQELVARIERWKARQEGGGRDVDEIIEESPVEPPSNEAPETLWGENEVGAEAEPSFDATEAEPVDAMPESLEQVDEVFGEETIAEEAPGEETPVEEAPVEEVVAEPAPVEASAEEPPADEVEELASDAEPLSIEPDDLVEEPPVDATPAEDAVAVESDLAPEAQEEAVDSTTEIAVEEFEEVKDD